MRVPDLRVITARASHAPCSAPRPLPLSEHPLFAPAVAGLVLVAATGALVLGVTLLAQRRQERELVGLASQLRRLEQAPPVTAARSCTPASSWLETITRQEEQGRWDAAFTNAQTALTQPDLCKRDRGELSRKAVSAGLAALLTTPLPPADVAAQRDAVARYHNLRQLAKAYGVPFPKTPRQVASDAYNVEAFLLSKEAADEAFASRLASTVDLTQLQLYADTFYNLGSWWARNTDGATRREGLQYLAASHALDNTFHLARGQAASELRQLLGPDENGWPAPAASPLLSEVVETPLDLTSYVSQ